MSKLILLLLFGILAFLFFKGFQRRASRRAEDVPEARPSESMVACARCGIHLPVGESIEGKGGRFCSEEHRRLGAA